MAVRYFDHAATSWPKPAVVMEAMNICMEQYAANPGRGGHAMAIRASRTLFEARKQLAKLFGIHNPNDISFTLNTTEALNVAIKGYIKPGDHLICTAIEHNSVRRPIEYMRKNHQVDITYVATNQSGELNMDDLEAAVNSRTKLIVCTHSSNLLGSILPIEQIAELARKHKVRLLVDAAQSAGILPIDVGRLGIDMLAFPGHKGLLGPQGTGGLYISPELDLEPLIHGGTGSQSEEIEQPSVRPDRYEAGTQNTVGLAGLAAAVAFIRNETVETIHQREWQLTQRLMEELAEMNQVRQLGPKLGVNKTGIVSFVVDKKDSAEIAFLLDRDYQIATRAGMHCTPLAHETAGTLATGAVRASIGYYTTAEDIAYFAESLKKILQR